MWLYLINEKGIIRIKDNTHVPASSVWLRAHQTFDNVNGSLCWLSCLLIINNYRRNVRAVKISRLKNLIQMDFCFEIWSKWDSNPKMLYLREVLSVVYLLINSYPIDSSGAPHNTSDIDDSSLKQFNKMIF